MKKLYNTEQERLDAVNARNKRRYVEDPDFNARRKESSRKHSRKRRLIPEQKEREREYAKKRSKDPAVRARTRELARFYTTGFSPELVASLREFQGGKCAICNVVLLTTGPQGSTREQADHCHDANTPRGLLCLACNRGLGYYERMKAAGAEEYLTETPVSKVSK